MVDARNLIIVGPMAAGKSLIGQRLAKKLQLPFYDTDQTIEARTGVDIPFIFDKEGEVGFRKREKEIVKELTCKKGIVLSTGGGTVLDADNRRYLQSSGIILYLKVSIASQLMRTTRNKNKPLLLVEDREQVLINLKAIRTPFYEQMATLTYDTDKSPVQDIVKQMIADLELLSFC